MNHGHTINQCKHGIVGSRCRCMGPHTINIVSCDRTQCMSTKWPVPTGPRSIPDFAIPAAGFGMSEW